MSDVTVAEQRRRFASWVGRVGGGSPPAVQETHVSFVAFAGDRVWKCKKAVRFPFIDLSTLERRRVNCERELALNRRLAPDVYLDVVPLEADGTVVDYVVEMRRLPDDCRLASVVRSDPEAGRQCVDAISDALVRFHAAARRGGEIDDAAAPAALEHLWRSNLAEMRGSGGFEFDAAVLDEVEHDALTYLAGRAPLFADRIARGCIRDGHGDLLADDVFCLPDGPRILDCLEFDDTLRYGDVLADVAFLAMDLEWLERPDLASALLDGYRRRRGDTWPASLAHFYVAYRALVRAKVAGLRAPNDPDAAGSAIGHLGLAAGHLHRGRVHLVLIGGAPATGKTTTAREVARVTGWTVLRSDEMRKELAGLAPESSAAAPLDEGLYSPEWDERTYTALLERARVRLGMGESVILDASWSERDRRDAVGAAARATASELCAFVCEVPAGIAGERADRRAREGLDASDATAPIARAVRERFDPWPEAVAVDTSEAPELVARRIARTLAVSMPD